MTQLAEVTFAKKSQGCGKKSNPIPDTPSIGSSSLPTRDLKIAIAAQGGVNHL